MEYKKTLEIVEFNGYLIIKLLDDNGPKIKLVGTGTMISNFNHWDIAISKEALAILEKNLLQNINKPDPAMEIIAQDKIWWSAIKKGIIIQPNELIHIHCIPFHSICENSVDDKLKNILKNLKQIS